MIAVALLRLVVARRTPFLAACSLLLGLFQFLICAAVSSVDIAGVLRTVLESLPPVLQGLVASQLFGGLSPHALLAFGWNHPVSQALGTAAAILLGVRAISGEIESGAVEFLLSQPLSRATYFATQAAFALLALALLSGVGMLGTIAGQGFFHMDPLGTGQVLRLGCGYFLLQSAWFAVTLVFSAAARQGGRVASLGFLLALGSYFAQVIGRLWARAAFVLPWTLHNYFAPQSILQDGESTVRSTVTLLAVIVTGVAVAAWQFRRRDLP